MAAFSAAALACIAWDARIAAAITASARARSQPDGGRARRSSAPRWFFHAQPQHGLFSGAAFSLFERAASSLLRPCFSLSSWRGQPLPAWQEACSACLITWRGLCPQHCGPEFLRISASRAAWQPDSSRKHRRRRFHLNGAGAARGVSLLDHGLFRAVNRNSAGFFGARCCLIRALGGAIQAASSYRLRKFVGFQSSCSHRLPSAERAGSSLLPFNSGRIENCFIAITSFSLISFSLRINHLLRGYNNQIGGVFSSKPVFSTNSVSGQSA